ncbi:OVARIAN TUMOR DOMAIN-containing deubiquitinating enzyme 4-like isoform X2 [Magnolia sinica]|uniref:OVARIAN TUMOR DOMAIN-containing deubiquitinating enzyme 4-like isoform X2 n=1 Tax=Magnolia sinica TaxID=86752 RepID=UPI002659F0D5|nr:OVARIAN TUMOR DOMAIN-containing deubiquitinating enzyme 4-like isoform X2 [Magnolia sinica]
MTIYFHISTHSKRIVHVGGNIGKQMLSPACAVPQSLSNSCCNVFHTIQFRQRCTAVTICRTFSCSSIGLSAFDSRCLRSGLFKQQRNWPSFMMKSLVSCGGHRTIRLGLSSWCQNMSLRLTVPNCGGVSKISWNVRPSSWLQGGTSAGLIFGVCVCFLSSGSVHAEASMGNNDEKDERGSSSFSTSSHGKKVYTDYSVTGIPGDGRCLFRSVVHGACLRSGKPSPSETLQKQLADELRSKVADEFVKRREETEWMPITVYMYDEDSGGLIAIAEYGQEYGKEDPIRVLYHGFGHYESLQIPGKRGGKSRL